MYIIRTEMPVCSVDRTKWLLRVPGSAPGVLPVKVKIELKRKANGRKTIGSTNI